MKPKFVMLIGLPASGKSTFASKTFGGGVVVSTDGIRGELFGDESVQGDPDKVFAEAKRRSVDALNSGCDCVVFDATNLKRKYRVPIIKEIRRRVNKEIDVVAVWVAVPYSVCIERDSNRGRTVGEKVIRRMYMNFVPPSKAEGFDAVFLHYNCTPKDMDGYTEEAFLGMAMGYDQHNSHHTLTLGEHCTKACEYVRKHGGSELLCTTALLHDNGKPFTATYVNGKGEVTEECHYYQHHCVGSYDIVFYLRDLPTNSVVRAANLIYYHMHPLVEWKSEAKRKKDVAEMDEDFYNDLMLLHEGDLNAH